MLYLSNCPVPRIQQCFVFGPNFMIDGTGVPTIGKYVEDELYDVECCQGSNIFSRIMISAIVIQHHCSGDRKADVGQCHEFRQKTHLQTGRDQESVPLSVQETIEFTSIQYVR